MKSLEIVTMMDIKEHQQIWFIGFLKKKTRSGISVNEQLAQELHKLVIKKFKKTIVCARFNDNILAADLAEMKLLPSNNNNVKYLLCVIDAFIKYVQVKHWNSKKGKTVQNAFI